MDGVTYVSQETSIRGHGPAVDPAAVQVRLLPGALTSTMESSFSN